MQAGKLGGLPGGRPQVPAPGAAEAPLTTSPTLPDHKYCFTELQNFANDVTYIRITFIYAMSIAAFLSKGSHVPPRGELEWGNMKLKHA